MRFECGRPECGGRRVRWRRGHRQRSWSSDAVATGARPRILLLQPLHETRRITWLADLLTNFWNGTLVERLNGVRRLMRTRDYEALVEANGADLALWRQVAEGYGVREGL